MNIGIVEFPRCFQDRIIQWANSKILTHIYNLKLFWPLLKRMMEPKIGQTFQKKIFFMDVHML